MKYISTILICILWSVCYSQENKNLIKNWQSYTIPTNQDTLRKYNYSNAEWAVSLRNDSIYAGKYIERSGYDLSKLPFKINPDTKEKKEMYGKISLLKVEDGYLVGFYHGEWGGSLFWFSSDGKKYYKISNDEIVQFITRDGRNYAIQGLAHLSMSEGSIILIGNEKGKRTSGEFLKLPTAPDAIALDNHHDFIVITSKSLLRIDGNNKISILIDRGIWYDGLYTNSMVIKDNIIYAGMRAGVFKYNLSTGQQNWLLPY